jgi:membrane protein implicated in regulation of membrane protease activity
VTRSLLGQRLLALLAAGALLLNFPLLRLWMGAGLGAGGTLWGLPLLPLALFVLWAGLIAVLALLMERRDDGDADTEPAAHDGG